jgi:hypothetical protein
MSRRIAIVMAVALLGGCAEPKPPATFGFEDLPDPPIALVHVLQPGESALAGPNGSQGVVDIHLSESQPIYEIWNDPQTRQDPWGAILLESVHPDGTTVVWVRGEKLSAEVGAPLPGTGIVVIQADPELQTATLRSKWTLTEKEPPSP